MRRFSNLIGVDDAPFARAHRGDVAIVGAVTAAGRLDGALIGRVRRDGADATRQVAAMIGGSRFHAHAQAVVLQGIALAGFNVIDLAGLAAALDRPVLAVARRRPDLAAIERALTLRVRGGRRKWALIAAAGPMEPCEGVWVQRAGLSPAAAAALIREGRAQGALPECLRLAHLIAGAIGEGTSRGRA